MPTLTLVTDFAAPPARCFDLVRSVELHLLSAAATGERAVAGVTAGLLGPGDEVTFRARHLGIWQELTTRITLYDRPHRLRGSQRRGAFRRFEHDHHFAPAGAGTRLVEVVDFAAPLGPLGRLAERLVLTPHLRRFLTTRMRVVRAVAESDGGWRAYVSGEE